MVSSFPKKDKNCGSKKYLGHTSEIKSIKPQKFWDEVQKKSALKQIPFKSTFELTHRCNLYCSHCYIPFKQSSDSIKNKRIELSFSEVCSVLDQLADLGCFFINFTGGEPLIRPDFFEILAYAKKKGFYVGLLTNATLVTPFFADALKDLSIDQIDITLYGKTQKTYENITRVEGSYVKCLSGIRLLVQRNVNITIKMMVLTLNLAEFENIKTFAENLGIRFVWGYLVHPRLDGSKEPLKYRIPPKKAVDLELRYRPQFFEKQKDMEKKKELFTKSNGFLYCSAGTNSLAISPFGEMNLCLEYRQPKYDWRKGNAAEGWKKLVKYTGSLKPDSTYQCWDCEFEEDCNWCPAAGILERGEKSACIPYYRKLAGIRRKRELLG